MYLYDDIGCYLQQSVEILQNLDIQAINQVVTALLDVYRRNGQIFVFGNGGSAATASHMLCDFNKGLSHNLSLKFKVICLNDNIPSLLAIANDIDFSQVFKLHLENFLTEKDLVLGISGSGNSENVLQAVTYAIKKGAVTVAFTGFDGGRLRCCAHHVIHVNSHDMQKVEDTHLLLMHLIMQVLRNYLVKEDAL